MEHYIHTLKFSIMFPVDCCCYHHLSLCKYFITFTASKLFLFNAAQLIYLPCKLWRSVNRIYYQINLILFCFNVRNNDQALFFYLFAYVNSVTSNLFTRDIDDNNHLWKEKYLFILELMILRSERKISYYNRPVGNIKVPTPVPFSRDQELPAHSYRFQLVDRSDLNMKDNLFSNFFKCRQNLS